MISIYIFLFFNCFKINFFRYLPELLFYMTELKLMVLKHTNIISRYYTDYVCGYDAVLINEMVNKLTNLSPNDDMLIRSFMDSVTNIKSIFI